MRILLVHNPNEGDEAHEAGELIELLRMFYKLEFFGG
jgi:hypothetical protein